LTEKGSPPGGRRRMLANEGDILYPVQGELRCVSKTGSLKGYAIDQEEKEWVPCTTNKCARCAERPGVC